MARATTLRVRVRRVRADNDRVARGASTGRARCEGGSRSPSRTARSPGSRADGAYGGASVRRAVARPGDARPLRRRAAVGRACRLPVGAFAARGRPRPRPVSPRSATPNAGFSLRTPPWPSSKDGCGPSSSHLPARPARGSRSIGRAARACRFPHELILTCLAETTQHGSGGDARGSYRCRQRAAGCPVRVGRSRSYGRFHHDRPRGRPPPPRRTSRGRPAAARREGRRHKQTEDSARLSGRSSPERRATSPSRLQTCAGSAAEILVPSGPGHVGALSSSAPGSPARTADRSCFWAAAPTRREDASRRFVDAGLLLQRLTGVDVEPRLIAPGRKGLIDAARDGGLLVMGLDR